MIIGICGNAGVGKDTTADFLVKNNGFVKVSLADPMKRICKEVYWFTDEQLWGQSEKRNEPDERYIQAYSLKATGAFLREEGREEPDPIFTPVPVYLTPRHALQQLGTEWGRNCYENTWVDIALRAAKELLSDQEEMAGAHCPRTGYSPQRGLIEGFFIPFANGVVIPDVRFRNEVDAIKKAGGRVIRLYRPEAGLSGAAADHVSETGIADLPDGIFDALLFNNKDLLHLEKITELVLDCLRQGHTGPHFQAQVGTPS